MILQQLQKIWKEHFLDLDFDLDYSVYLGLSNISSSLFQSLKSEFGATRVAERNFASTATTTTTVLIIAIKYVWYLLLDDDSMIRSQIIHFELT